MATPRLFARLASPVLFSAWLFSAWIVVDARSAQEVARTPPSASRADPNGPVARATPLADWPRWRGPASNNHAAPSADGVEAPPKHWDADGDFEWKTALPGRGHASPCVAGNTIYIAAADEAVGSQFLLAIDRGTGDVVWNTEIHRGPLPTINAKNSHASPTPSCDGERVYVLFAHDEKLTLSAVSLSGTIVWQTDIGAYRHANGLGASPTLHGGLAIVASDNPVEPQLAAVDCRDGRIVWRTPRKASDSSATPIVGQVAGRAQLMINGAWSASSYDPATGDLLWQVDHATEVCACTMAFDDERAYASANVPKSHMLAVRGDGSGDVSMSHVAWETNKSIVYVPSPLCVDNRLYLVTDAGVAFCRDAATGEIKWQHRLGGNFSASPVYADGCIYALNEEGVTFVFRAADEFLPIAENDLGEPCLATPAICGNRVYIRTASNLAAIKASKPAPH